MNDETPVSENGRTDQKLRPYWWPKDMAWEDLPEEARVAMEAIVEPGYRELVAGAEGVLERLAGMSVVYLSNLEVLDQIALAKDLAAAEPQDIEKRVAEHVRLTGAKLRAANFVHRLRKARDTRDAIGRV